MAGPFAFRHAERGDIPQLMALMNAQYVRKKNEAYFIWQYFESALPTALICAESEGKISGMFGLQRRELRNGAVVGQAIDLLVAPDARGTGVFAEMGNRAVAQFPGLDVLCVLPNANGRRAVEKSLGWSTAGKIDALFTKPSTMSSEAAPRVYASSVPSAQFVMTLDIMDWRFRRHPEFSYEEIRLSPAEYAITKVFKDPVQGKRFGDIVALECDLTDVRTMADLVRRACAALGRKTVESITMWALPHTALRPVAESLGFVTTEQERYLCVKILNAKYTALNNLASWYLMQADTEMF